MGGRRASKKPDHKAISNRVARALLAAAQILTASPHQFKELHAAVVGDPPPKYEPLRLSNPVHMGPVGDPELREVSERFHGTPDLTARLDPDQQVPREVVVVGQLEGIEYKPSRKSKRGGITWSHEAGDAGDNRPRNRGRGLVVTDGRGVWAIPSSNGPEFSPEEGLLG